VGVPIQELRKLLAGSRGTAIVAQRFTGAELRLFEHERRNSDAAVHGAIINREELRFRRSGAAARANADRDGHTPKGGGTGFPIFLGAEKIDGGA